VSGSRSHARRGARRRPRGARARVRRALLACGACALLVCAPDARAAQQVSYPQLLEQVRSGPLIRAVINRRGHDVEIKFRDSTEWRAFYPPGAQPELQRLLHERHIRVIFAAPPRTHRGTRAAVHHHLRYIAAAALAALVLAATGWWMLRRRSRAPGTRAPDQPPAG